MCGIAGFVRTTGSDDSISTLNAMTDAIYHRGPDDEGFFTAVSLDRVYQIGLGHRRLSIIDLHAGHQPIGNEDGSVQIVFNGEIYNFKELRDELISLGHSFLTESDTETIVHAYEQYGERCVDRLRGMFSFAIWDSAHQRLFLARDRFGKKPLFLAEFDGELFFASEIKAILAARHQPIEVNQQAVWDYVSYRYVPGPATLFKGVRKLAPGSYAIWEHGCLVERRYYAPPDMAAWQRSPRLNDIVGAFLQQLEDAVICRMVSDVPFGAFLSGGIDSSAVVGLMSHHSDMPVKTFSVGFDESDYSELSYARVIAEQYRTEHHELTVSQEHLMDYLPELVRYRDAPVSEPSDVPIFLLAKEASKTVKMVLTGEGSDEFLGGYPKHVFERYVSAYQIFPAFMRYGLLEPLVRSLPYRFRRAKTAVLNMGLDDSDERMVRWFGALSRRERKSLMAAGLADHVSIAGWQTIPSERRTALRRILSFDQASWLPDNLLERGDRMTMAASIEARMPFLDHKLAEFVSSLPDTMRVRGKNTKWLLREAMKRMLPAQILERPKVGFRVPVNEWFRGSMKDYLYDHILSPSSLTKAYYKPEALGKILSEHVEGRQNHEKLLWALLTLELWHREYAVTV